MQSILLDIEGTTTPVEFVYKVLFPYARHHVKEFLLQSYATEAVKADIKQLRNEHASDQQQKLNPPFWQDESGDSQAESIQAYVHWLMDQDRKSTGLKSLQGKIWEQGYRSGELHSQVYEDVPPALLRWSEQKKAIYIYSSGSVLAQRLLFQYTTAGDLTRFLRGYFDTTTGPKREPASYGRIAKVLRQPPSEILFISDSIAELDAAGSAGLQTTLCVRPGEPWPQAHSHAAIRSFDEISPSIL